ncbi:MAG: hypothetical protein RIM84_01305 [Alphaproteobacteria bacterium]
MIRLVTVLVLLALASCGGGPLVRDDYLGLSWLEPERKAEPVRRDGNGNPILPPAPTAE